MALTAVLGIVIGLSFVFLVMSLVVSWIQELIATLFKWRAKHLVNIIQHMLNPSVKKLNAVKSLENVWDDKVGDLVKEKLKSNAVKAFYEHPIIKGLSKSKKLPSYIPTREFGTVLFNLLFKAGTEKSPGSEGLKAIKTGIGEIGNEATKQALNTLVESVEISERKIENKIAECRKRIEAWFDSVMERASGWYRRKSQVCALCIGLGLAILFNVDAVNLTRSLWQNSVLREAITQEAEEYIDGEEVKTNTTIKTLQRINIPIGWEKHNRPEQGWEYPLWILGWFLTAFAVSQGSSVWFDVLNRFVNLRGGGKKPEKSIE